MTGEWQDCRHRAALAGVRELKIGGSDDLMQSVISMMNVHQYFIIDMVGGD